MERTPTRWSTARARNVAQGHRDRARASWLAAWFTAIGLMILPASLAALPADGASGGIPIAPTENLEFSPMVVSDGAGGAFLSWMSGSAVMALAIDQELNPRLGWPASGIHVLGGSDPFLAADGPGRALIVSRSGIAVAFQFIPLQGAIALERTASATASRSHFAERPLDTSDNRPPTEVLHEGYVLPVVTPDGLGGAFVAYTNRRTAQDITRLRHYDADGALIERTLGPNCFCYSTDPTICPDGAGGMLVVWGKAGGSACGVRVLRMTPDLAVAPGWPDTGVVVGPCGVGESWVGICTDGAGGAYVTWQSPAWTFRPGLFLQRVTSDGSIAPGWPATGLVLSPHPTLPGFVRLYFGSACSIVPDGSGGALVAWTDQRADTGDVYVQRVLSDGSIASGWPLYGVAAGMASGMQEVPMAAADGSGGAFVAWQDQRSDGDSAIYANRVDATGSIASPGGPGGVRVSHGPGFRLTPRIVGDGAGGAIVVWVDYRNGNGDIYAAHLISDSTTPTLPSLIRAEATPTSVRLEWSVGVETLGELEVQRRSENADFAWVGNTTTDGSGRVVHVDESIEPGRRYAYRLGYPWADQIAFTSEVWVEIPQPYRLSISAVSHDARGGNVMVAFQLPSAGAARLELFDVVGRKLAERRLAVPNAGAHQESFSGIGSLPSGMYVLTLRHDDAVAVRKTLVVK